MLLVIYALIVTRGLNVVVRDGRTAPEVFPFFVWELFSRVPPAERESYGLRFVSVNGDLLGAPMYFEEAGAYLPTSHSPEAQQIIRQMGQALAAGQPLGVAFNRDILETRHMQQLTSADYEIVRVRFDLLERFDCPDCYLEETPVAQFTLGD